MLLHGLVEKVASENPHKEAVVFKDIRITYQELNEKTERFALGLIEKGVKKGDIVAILMPSIPEYIIAALGIWKAGAAVLPINFHYTISEIAYALNSAKVSTLILVDQYSKYNYINKLSELKNQVPTLKELILISSSNRTKGQPQTTLFESLFADYPHNNDELLRRKHSASPEDIAFIVFTGGTTGIAKGAIISHKGRYLVDKGWGDALKMSSKDVILLSLPLFHLFVWHSVIAGFMNGASIIMMEEFNVDLSLQLIEKEKVTFLIQVPTMYIYQINAPDVGKYDLSSLRIGGTGGAIFPEELFDKCESKLGGLRIINIWGLTEACGLVTLTRLDDSFEHARRSVGKRIQGFKLKIVDEERKEVPLGTDGEVAVKPSWYIGYYNMPEETEKAIDSEGWLYTGDLGSLDADGYLYLKGRTKDMIISGGENIYPMEIESVLQKHPDILMSAVIGIPHPKMGEVGKAFIVPRENRIISEDQIKEYLTENLAKIKIPREIVICESLPLTSVGKIKKDELRSMSARTSST